ncbi:hypothetical protein [Streptomyces sp. NPDC047000]|uniref:hypothetical protein n=1 Tax=Streptomyces sp. NPDC047000 TaxID=3155474 RepID=UPI0033C858D0
MSDHEMSMPPNDDEVRAHLDQLRLRMDPDDYALLLELLGPALRAVWEQRFDDAGFGLDDDERSDGVPQEVRDAAALVVATAITGRRDNEVIEIHTEETGLVRVVTDVTSAHDPERRDAIAECLRRRHRDDAELRGIAAASGMPTDF